MSPDSQYLSSNSILSPFSQHLSPHPNNFTIQSASTNSSHIYVESPRGNKTTTATNGGLNQHQISRHENFLNNFKNNNLNKLSEAPALPNILATLDDLTSRRQYQKDSTNNNQNVINQKCDFQSAAYKQLSSSIELNNSGAQVVSQQYILPPSTTPIPINRIDDSQNNKDNSINSSTTTVNQQQYHQNLNNVQALHPVDQSIVKTSSLTPANIFNENQQQQQPEIIPPIITASQNSINPESVVKFPSHSNNNNSHTPIQKTFSHHSHPGNSRKYLNLPLNSPTPSLPEFDFIRHSNNILHNNEINNLPLDICFKEPGSVASYYSAPANLGSERILDDFTFPNFFRENELNTPKNSHGNLEDFYTEQLQNFLEGQVINLDSSIEENNQNCDTIEIIKNLNSESGNQSSSTSNVNNSQNVFDNINNSDPMHVNNNGNSMKIESMDITNTNIFNSNIDDNHNDIIKLEDNNSNNKLVQNGKTNSGNNNKSHFKPPSLLDSNKMLLSEHYINKIILFECKLCGKYYKNERSYSKHQKIHGGSCPKCQICGKTFQSRKRLLNHNQELCKSRQDKRCKTQTSSDSTSSQIMEFSNNNNINKNEINQNNDNISNKNQPKPNNNNTNSQMDNKNNESNVNSNLFLQNLHGQKKGDNEPKQQKLQQQQQQQLKQVQQPRKELSKVPKRCQFCPRTFIREAHLRTHEKNHDVIYNCEHCPRTFKFKNACLAHMRIHTGEKPYKCSVCPAAFATSSNLKAHQLIHTDEKPFECTFGCGKAFSMKRLRKWHEHLHTGEKPFQCEICGKHFAMQSRLSLHRKQRHMDINLRPHECSVCLKRFLHPTGLRDHMNIHNGNKPYECPFDNCDKRFPNQNRLWEHKKLHTSYKRHECQKCNKTFTQYSGLLTHKKFCNNNQLLSSSKSS